MLDDIIEFIVDLVLEIIIAVWGEKNVPKPIQIALGIILLALVFGVCGIVIGIGIRDANMIPIAVGAGLLVLFIGVAIYLVRKHRRENGI